MEGTAQVWILPGQFALVARSRRPVAKNPEAEARRLELAGSLRVKGHRPLDLMDGSRMLRLAF